MFTNWKRNAIHGRKRPNTQRLGSQKLHVNMFFETTRILLTHHRINEHGNIKVADFGLSKNVSGNVYFRQQMSSGVKLPIKWMAIESIEDGIFTEKTDIVRKTIQ